MADFDSCFYRQPPANHQQLMESEEVVHCDATSAWRWTWSDLAARQCSWSVGIFSIEHRVNHTVVQDNSIADLQSAYHIVANETISDIISLVSLIAL